MLLNFLLSFEIIKKNVKGQLMNQIILERKQILWTGLSGSLSQESKFTDQVSVKWFSDEH